MSETAIANRLTLPKLRGDRSTGELVAFAIALVGLAVMVLVIIAVLAASFGTLGLLICGAAALIPLSIVLLGVRWVDRWEPEPRSATVSALLWGASAAVILALLLGLPAELMGVRLSDYWLSVAVAPVTEEAAKGLGLLLVFLIWRTTFTGVVDGLVYGMTIGAGFAFTENILYFGDALSTGGAASLSATFVMRGMLSPFAHAMFTAVLGIAVGWAVGTGRPVHRWAIGGLAGAVALHALWNLAAGVDFLLLYVLVQVPMFIIGTVFVTQLRARERARLRLALEDYCAAGWLRSDEVGLIATAAGRRTLRRWAAARGPAYSSAAGEFVRASTELAVVRERVRAGFPSERSARREFELLTHLTEVRRTLFT
ncbi:MULTISPECIES: PrsW family intramembrane metalloprotease [unclassified Leucobacter]|uniref:PrsW family intramembrane metalloprotease n=1 Tax=unclassified Leucobacter TaxID=2621730 RepID=UPI00165E8EFA|nr:MULTISPECIES: PrsW family intramembrane metalloprotease [unclassified Leucobacter]MBC9926037.1 PrsW family intramembrane metalloprotease [Leucobacter sp. cx-169]MBC9935690.1 PrsW family intramembrane metalloprotease [Leucobacter sp. cx-87]